MQALGPKLHLGFAAQVLCQPAFDKTRAESPMAWRNHGWAARFPPRDLQHRGPLVALDAPRDRHAAVALGQGAVFRGIGGQLMERHAEDSAILADSRTDGPATAKRLGSAPL